VNWSTCISGSVYTLSGSGTDIGGNSDQFQFAYTSGDNADYDVSGRIIQQDQVNPQDKLGIMVRDSLTNTSRFAYLASVNNGASFIFEYRSAPSGPVTKFSFAGHAFPYWVKLSKTATTYTAFLSGDGISWVQVGSAVNLNFGTDNTNAPHYGMAITSANNSLLSTGKIDNFNVLGSTPLPIKLMSFTAKNINNDHVLVSWATSMEHLVDQFEIQKSVDNNNFQTIDQVNAVGESEIPHYYSVTDNKPAGGTNFYRLKEIDKDNKFYYSPVVSVDFDVTEDLEIYPNPADNFTNIYSRRDLILDVSIFDITGKLVQNVHSSSGLNTVRINTSELPKAVYFIRVKTHSNTYRRKLFKQ